jgi:hypothetical protein
MKQIQFLEVFKHGVQRAKRYLTRPILTSFTVTDNKPPHSRNATCLFLAVMNKHRLRSLSCNNRFHSTRHPWPTSSRVTTPPHPEPSAPASAGQRSVIMARNGRLNGDASPIRLKCCGGRPTRALIGGSYFKTRPGRPYQRVCVRACGARPASLARCWWPVVRRRADAPLSSSLDAVRCSVPYDAF